MSDHHCAVCDIYFTEAHSLKSHNKTKTHLKRLAAVEEEDEWEDEEDDDDMGTEGEDGEDDEEDE
ncbi:uncharacterized protein EHS24_006392 [Apiotrichum porosum]|uniref:C2H2-type domain-containing protein n=1 Tax=Apiotrichum porosum TaxID=105984 RepID=A0A427Y1E5_9TREE|nr:uncharacterized protein EHS24_006392 [Apiotrichum porosum]RSH84860.1 hypothetical protein EHS24_006392 [Apiotrichum porosum]